MSYPPDDMYINNDCECGPWGKCLAHNKNTKNTKREQQKITKKYNKCQVKPLYIIVVFFILIYLFTKN